ncbi:acetyl-CoA synthetase-like protein [Wallemia mellicola]|nr:acetyl-CoA synthetase-like protein [Wallemia mellicola]
MLDNYTHNPIKNLGTQSRVLECIARYESVLVNAPQSANTEKLVRVAYTVLLMKYLDSQDVVLGETTKDYIEDPEATLIHPIRVQLEGSEFLSDVAESINKQLLTNVPLSNDDARLELGVKDDKVPLQALFVWGVDLDSCKLSDSLIMGGISTPEGFKLSLHSDGSLISAISLKVFIDQVKVVLERLVQHQDARIGELFKSFPQNLSSHATKTLDMTQEGFVVDWLFKNAVERGDKIAHECYADLDSQPILLTWYEFNKRSNQLARWLVDRGVKLEDRVSLSLPRCPEFYIAMAAIFKAGGCYTSIDPELPEERKKYIAKDSESKVIFTTSENITIFTEAAVDSHDTDLWKQVDAQDSSDINLAKLDSLSYLLYTSGTTGNPKGCLIEHRALYWAMVTFGDYPIPISDPESDKRLAMASLAFDVHISEITQSWHEKLRLVTVPRAQLLGDLREYIVKLHITHLGMVPSMIEALLETPEGLPLKYLISGGEKITQNHEATNVMPSQLLEKWANRPNLILANFYGPTELTIGISARKVLAQDTKENVGKVFPSCDALVVDKEMNIVPLGTPGELVVEGPLVARGYLNLDHLTAKSFVKFPNADSWAYKTGDLVRMTPDNSIEIMGRIDSQVKYRGVRLETEGVSNILRLAANEDEELLATTLITQHPSLNQEVLVSFVAPSNSNISVIERRTTSPTIQYNRGTLITSLKNAVDRELPVYMRPAYIIPTNFIPLTLNGKSDNKVLAQVFKLTPMQSLLKSQSN